MVWTCTRGCMWRWREYDHLLPKAALRLGPGEFVSRVEALLGRGHSVHVVYEACGFGFSLYRQLIAAGAHCYVIAPRKLDEERSRVKTDPRDVTTLCQRLSRYLEGNTRELALIRVPSEEEEQARQMSRQRGQLVHHRQKLEAQGRSLLINHALPAPAHWWKEQTWTRLGRHLPAWITTRLQTGRPVLLSLQEQINALTSELEASAPSILPRERVSPPASCSRARSAIGIGSTTVAHQQFLHRALSWRTQQWQQGRARQRDQAR